MKKISFSIIVMLSALSAAAQESFNPLKDRQLYFDILNIIAILSVIYLISTFILQLVRSHLSHRLKSRIIDRQVPETVVQQLLLPEKKDRGQIFVQWFCVLAAIAIGLIIVRITFPFGLHSLAILAASLAGGCAAAYYFTKKAEPLPKQS